ncbi:PAS-domain containing protein [Dankookia sp. GCM10030260]|uniref:PAS-domain containing protein n=1 Tax=Dankookia sp. GCM10030260 TaxID=3273390 RepID=UPI0036196469
MHADAEVQAGRPAHWMDRAGLALGLGLVALVWLLVGLGIRAEFRRASDTAWQATATLARTLEAEVAGRLRTIETILRYGSALHARDPAAFAVPDWIRIDPEADIIDAAIVGPDGLVRVNLDGVPPAPVDLRDRDYIAAILADPSYDRLEISPPLTGRVTGRPSIDIARPLRDAAGGFVGIIMVAVDGDGFARLYRRLDLRDSMVGLTGLDGIVRVRVPETDKGGNTLLGARVSDESIAAIRAGATETGMRQISAIDGVDRFFTVRRVAGLPLVVTVGTAADTVLAAPRRERAKLLVTGGFLTLLIAAVWLAARHVRRRERRSRAQLEAVIAHVGQGIMMIDPAHRLAVMNRRVEEMLGLPPGLAVPGRPVREIVAWQEATGEFGGGPAPMTHVDSLGGPDRRPVVTLRSRPDGSVLEIRTAHVGDGSHVRTFTDVTAARRAAAAVAAARDQALAAEAALAAALENVPHGVMLIGPDDRILLCNQAAVDLAGVPAGLARPGTPIAELIAHQVAVGEIAPIAGSIPEAWLAMRAQAQDGRTYQRVKPDGRVIEVRSNFLADGRFIRTYTDVTAHHAALRAQEAARDQAQAAEAALTAALENVPHGVLLVGADNRVQIMNPTAVELTGLPAEAARPGAKVADLLQLQVELGEIAAEEPLVARSWAAILDRSMAIPTFQRTNRRGRDMEVRTTFLADGRFIRTYTDVTAHNAALRTQEAARDQAEAAQAALAAAFQNVPHGVLLIGADRHVQVINAIAADLVDLPPALARPGVAVRDILAFQLERGDFVASPAIADAAGAALDGPEPPMPPYERRLRDGRVIDVRTTHLEDGRVIRTFTDVTARHLALQAEAAARDQAEAAQAALAAAFENAPLGILLVGEDRRVQFINGVAVDLLGLPPALAQPGAEARDILQLQLDRGDLAGQPVLQDEAKAALQGPQPGLDRYERRLPDGRMMEVRSRSMPDGRTIRTYTDVTERHAALRAQETARLAAEAALRSRTEFLAIVSHELRTPLNAVIGLSEVLLLHRPRADQVADLETVRESGRQLLGLVDDILDVSRLERGRVVLREAAFAPPATLRAMAALIAPRAAAKGLAFALELDPALPAAALGDEERLRQVLFKLLDNAVKFTEAGSITLDATMVAAETEGWRLGICITDTGIGITPEAEARLFEPFAQADSSTARRFGGLGLGLAVSRLLLESMGGGIALERVAGGGSRFRVELPLRHAPAALPAPADTAPPDGAPPTAALRVLVAEDLAANRAVALALLRRLGHEAEAVEDGAAAVAAVQARAFDLVLMDIMMPGMDGIAATRAIRALPDATARVPIIAVTAHASAETAEECRAAGMDRFESKPLQTERLRQAIAAVMARP